jgi:hypothetical protein
VSSVATSTPRPTTAEEEGAEAASVGQVVGIDPDTPLRICCDVFCFTPPTSGNAYCNLYARSGGCRWTQPLPVSLLWHRFSSPSSPYGCSPISRWSMSYMSLRHTDTSSATTSDHLPAPPRNAQLAHSVKGTLASLLASHKAALVSTHNRHAGVVATEVSRYHEPLRLIERSIAGRWRQRDSAVLATYGRG